MKINKENLKSKDNFFNLPSEPDTSGLWDSHFETLQVNPENTGENAKVSQKENDQEIKDFYELAKEGENLADLKKIFGNNILERNTVLFVAERGIGKTYLALQLAIKVSQGSTDFLGEEINLHGNVLYINMELGASVIKRRLNKLYKSVILKNNNPYGAYCYTVSKDLNEVMPKIKKWVIKHNPVLVIIDNLRAAFSNSQNEKNSDMTKAIMQLNNLRDEYEFAALLVHHTKKGVANQLTNSDLQSGAGAITDLVDGDFFLRRSKQDKNFRILKRVKSRNCEDQEGAKLISFNTVTHWFELEQDNVNESEHVISYELAGADKESMKAKAKVMRANGDSFEKIGEELGVNKSTVSRWFKA